MEHRTPIPPIPFQNSLKIFEFNRGKMNQNFKPRKVNCVRNFVQEIPHRLTKKKKQRKETTKRGNSIVDDYAFNPVVGDLFSGFRAFTWIFLFLVSTSDRLSRSGTMRNLRRRFLTTAPTALRHRRCACSDGFLAATSKFFFKNLSMLSPSP